MKITVSGISKSYGKVKALSNLSFSLAPGKVTGLVGPNGAGKSTLFRLMSGREVPDCGDILFDDISAVDYPERLADLVGLMPDSLPENANWRIAYYLDFYARANGLTGDERRRRVEEIMNFTRLNGLEDRLLMTLSKGMKQRVSLARMLLASPKVLLLDEPAAGLDPRARIELREDIRRLAAEGKTIFLSSHILTEMEDMCDELMIIERGEIIRHGSIAEMELESKPDDGRIFLMLEFPQLNPEIMSKLEEIGGSNVEISASSRRSVIVAIAASAADDFMAAVFRNHLPLAAFCYRGRTLESLFMESTQGNVQ